MAGGKESPRQKMINMMYLVLTAMLALQISNAILQKFQLLNNSIERSNSAANDANGKSVQAIKEKIEKDATAAKYADVLRQANEVRKMTAEIDGYIAGLKQEVINAGGGIDPVTGGVKNPSEEEKVAILMVGANKNGKGYELKKKLNDFSVALQKFAAPNTKFSELAIDASQDPALAKTDASTRNKDFSELYFAQTPVPAALAVLSQKQSEARRLESQVLEYLATQVGIKEIKFDEIFAVVIPDARAVVAGQKYHAEVAIGAYSKSITPRISINGTALPIKDGRGVYEITAQGGEYDKNGQLKRSYNASVSYPAPDGSMKTMNKEETYTVLQPSVQIESASMPPLYFKCANELQTSSPGLGALYAPTFGGSGAEFIPGGGGKVTVVPNSAQVVLSVNNGGYKLKDFPFKVRRVPKPTVYFTTQGGKRLDEKRGESAAGLRGIVAVAAADENFKATNPKDANYRVSEFEVNLARGSKRVGNVPGGGSANISSLAQQAQAGDRYVIEVKKVERRNFKGEIESVDVGSVIVTVPLN
ncbi:type IX secretion system motor protein PorM/GldM [Emticicia agri]|uniref:Gliding motility protein GldM n=1 Tax=Emticicia agri TaxID=2492393 RepID=A0A4Q5M006_9BACT|nr:gliding motility protein GldM [Emticicia agri]RYU95157.1 gliding motility protein GldM [Emticicia agri]